MEAIPACGEVMHVRVWTVLGAAEHGREATMAELIDIVLDPPMTTRLAHEIRAHLRSNDLVRTAAGTVSEDRAVEVHDHALAHGIERAVRSAHADIGRHH